TDFFARCRFGSICADAIAGAMGWLGRAARGAWPWTANLRPGLSRPGVGSTHAARGRRVMPSVSRRAVAGLLGAALVALLSGCGASPMRIQITIHYSHYDRSRLTVPHGVPATFVITNTHPIDHQSI